jgi:hypothetical protein
MHKCALCGADTILFVAEVPLCPECCDKQKDHKKKPPLGEPAPDAERLEGVA